MLSNKDKKLFNQFASMVHEKFPTANIWAYGSRVRGDATVESDLAVCVVVDKHIDGSESAMLSEETARIIQFSIHLIFN